MLEGWSVRKDKEPVTLKIDLHVHTTRYSACSDIPPERLIPQAIKAGLDGVVITEHGYQWSLAELAALRARSEAPDFLLLAGFEYGSKQGDILIYGLMPQQVLGFPQGMPPAMAVRRAHDLGAVCVAAHPTRAHMGFDESLGSIPFDGIEVQSVNLREDEQRRAMELAAATRLRPVAASDAHRLEDLGRYATEFLDPIRTMHDLQECLRRGKFHPVTLVEPQRIGDT